MKPKSGFIGLAKYYSNLGCYIIVNSQGMWCCAEPNGCVSVDQIAKAVELYKASNHTPPYYIPEPRKGIVGAKEQLTQNSYWIIRANGLVTQHDTCDNTVRIQKHGNLFYDQASALVERDKRKHKHAKNSA